jgi:histidine triad (HIT) family protein
MAEDCVFCKIIAKEKQAGIIYEDGAVMAFLDQSPVVNGHSLVIPKKHFKTILDVPSSLLGHIMDVVKRLALKQMKEMKAEGFNIRVNNFKVAGQVVMHSHFHIIPRFKGDTSKGRAGEKYTDKEIEGLLKD